MSEQVQGRDPNGRFLRYGPTPVTYHGEEFAAPGEAPKPIRCITFLDASGDTTLGWEPADAEWVLPMIQKKIDEGYSFWILKPGPVVQKIRRVSELTANDRREVIVKDTDARILLEQGRIGIVSRPAAAPPPRQGDPAEPGDMPRARARPAAAAAEGERETVGRARTAEEVANNDTVAHKPLRGG